MLLSTTSKKADGITSAKRGSSHMSMATGGSTELGGSGGIGCNSVWHRSSISSSNDFIFLEIQHLVFSRRRQEDIFQPALTTPAVPASHW